MNTKTLIPFLALALLLPGCGKENNAPEKTLGEALDDAANDAGDAISDAADDVKDAAEDAADDIEDAADDAGEGIADQFDKLRSDAITMAESGLASAENRFGELRTRVESAAEPIKAAVTPMLETAETKMAQIETDLKELRTAGAEGWKAISSRIGESLKSLNSSFDSIASKLGG